MDEHQIADRLRARIDSWEAYVAKPAAADPAADAAAGGAGGGEPLPAPLPPPPASHGALVPVFSPGTDRAGAEAWHQAPADDPVADLRSALEQERERGQTLEQAMARQRFLYAMTLRAEHERTKQRPQPSVLDVGPAAAGPSRRRGPSRMSARDAWAFLAALAALAFSIVYFLSAS